MMMWLRNLQSLIPLARASATAVVRSLSVTITPESISRITTLPQGLQWRKEDLKPLPRF